MKEKECEKLTLESFNVWHTGNTHPSFGRIETRNQLSGVGDFAELVVILPLQCIYAVIFFNVTNINMC